MRSHLITLAMLLRTSPAAAQSPATWTLSVRPVVEIGMAEGDPDYELFDARSSVRLVDGRIAVLNAGAAELRFYDAKGRFLFRKGSKGNGPGEYRWPARLYYTHKDSLVVFDQGNERESHLDAQGNFIASVDGAPVKEDPFRRDAWLYGRMFVDGPAIAAERGRIKPALNRLPPLATQTDYRYVKIDPCYRLWVREPHKAASSVQRWTIYSAEGQALATLDTPPRFEIHQIGPGFLLGRSRDELDIEYIHMYALQTRGTQTPRTYYTHAAARSYPAPAAQPTLPPAALATMRGYVRMAATQQEIHYSKKGAYTVDISLLNLEEDKDISAHIISASNRGWTMVVRHREADTLCAMAVGAVPIGWSPGMAICGERPVR